MAKIAALQQPWIRVILFIVTMVALAFGLMQLTEFLPLNAAPTEEGNPPLLVTLLFPIITVISSLIMVYIFRKKIDGKSIGSLGLNFKGNGVFAGTGICVAVVMIGIVTLVLYLLGNLEFTDIKADGNSIYIGLVLMALIAFAEELAFRGYVLTTLLPVTNRWLALIVSALLFAFVHAGNPGAGILPLVNVFTAGLLLGLNYIYTRNLWFGMLFHFGWNFLQGPVLGFPVSGLNLPSLLEAKLQGAPLITGAEFGLEGSIVALSLLVIMTALLAFIYRKKFEPAPVGPPQVHYKFIRA